MILFFESEYTLKQKSILSGVFFFFHSLTPVKTYERVLELKKVNNFFHALCSCKCMHFCNTYFLGTSTLFERNVYSKVRCITLHFFPFFYPQHLVSNKFNNQNLKPLTLTLIMTPAQALIKTSVTVSNSLILDYTLNLLMTLFL